MYRVALLTLALAPLTAHSSIFPKSLLAGTWEESAGTDQVCTGKGATLRYEFSSDSKALTVTFSKPIETDIGKVSSVRAKVVASTSRSLTIVYDGEKRLRSDGTPAQWELSVVAAGVYRWRETSWKDDEVNVVVGVRCSPR
jgi:hypothetical protein